MAFTQFAFERFRSGPAAVGKVHGCGPLYNGRLTNTGPQVYIELVQCVFERLIRRTAVRDTHGRNAVRSFTFRDIYEGAKDSSRIYV